MGETHTHTHKMTYKRLKCFTAVLRDIPDPTSLGNLSHETWGRSISLFAAFSPFFFKFFFLSLFHHEVQFLLLELEYGDIYFDIS